MEDSTFGLIESHVYQGVEWLTLLVEALGVLVIVWGVCFSLICYGGQLLSRVDQDYIPLRLSLARYLVVALEFQLAADILHTAVAPDWNAVGKLAAIAVIRTVLNYFLQKEMEQEVEMQESGIKDKIEDRMDGDEEAPTAPLHSSSPTSR